MIKSFWQDKEKRYYFLAGVVFFVGVILLLFILFAKKDTEIQGVESVSQEKVTSTESISCAFTSSLTGECVSEQNKEFVPLVGVMIENFVSARPQGAIAEAKVVYEAPVEGNITRFLALFEKDQEVKQAGPIRSARPYYLDWISEYPGALYMHVGGSPDAIQKLRAYDIFDMDEFFRGIYFWRDEKKDPPHNAFTSSHLWKSAFDRYAEKNVKYEFESWKFVTSTPATTPCERDCASVLEIPFLLPSYRVQWKYNAELTVYERAHGGEPHRESDGVVVKANTVVVQFVTDKILDDVGRRELGTMGSGKADVYIFGKKIEGTWKKETRTSRTRFFDANGEEVALAPGKIWIEVVPLQISVKN